MSSAPQSSPPAIPEPDRHKGMNRYFLKKKNRGWEQGAQLKEREWVGATGEAGRWELTQTDKG